MMKGSRWCVAIAAVALLSGCATPKQRCISEATQALRSVERDLDTARGNVARGYAIHTQQVPYTIAHTCYHGYGAHHAVIPYSCFSTHYRTQTIPVAIDVAEEGRKVEQFQELLPQLRERANAGVLQCNAQFPE